MEDWKDIKNYEGCYQVSSKGNVKNIRTNKILRKGKSEYYYVSLWKNNKGYTCNVHRLVAEAFILNPNNLPTVNHKDGNKFNNSIDNLEWASYGKNNQHAYDTKLKVASDKLRQKARERALERNKHSIRNTPVVKLDKDGNILKEYESFKSAAFENDVNVNSITRVCKGKIKSVKNMIFKYKEDFINEYGRTKK